ncbi:chalcone isomerase family protein [Cupriavidus sp. LEh21]|nr:MULTISPECIES: chalcone isomerase family protein [unclassified Cupriavidus]MDK2660586.1 chalcone isomerase family protein [Cupriavidus sp. LEh21]
MLLCATTAVAMPARAVEMEGIRFDDAARVGGKELQLNGTGLRAGFLTKGYVAALYLQEKARNATVVLGTPGAKRLQLRMLREAEPPAFARAIRKGIRDNHSETQVRGLAARLTQFERTLGEVGNAHKGDVINLDFSPQTGTVVAINGTPRGRPIPGEDFYQAVLRVFLGDSPVDQDVKRGLLGG